MPCYRSGNWLDELSERIVSVMRDLGETFELILVNDASLDGATWPAIVRNSEKYPEIRGLDLMSNVGQFRATLAGFEHSVGRLIITLDDDFQHPPEEIPKLIDAARKSPEVDCIMGAYVSKKHTPFRNIGSRLVNRIFSYIYDKPKNIVSTSFRILRSDLVKAVLSHKSSKPMLGATLLESSKRVKNVTVNHDPRKYGKSGYSLRKLIGFTLDNVFAATNAPLRWISIFGLFSALASLVLQIRAVYLWYFDITSVQGFTTQIILISFFGGMTLFSVGLLGEYVLRIVTEVSGPQRYFVREDTFSRQLDD